MLLQLPFLASHADSFITDIEGRASLAKEIEITAKKFTMRHRVTSAFHFVINP